jgi:putative flippase GtrA
LAAAGIARGRPTVGLVRQQFIRFLIVGASNTAITLLAYAGAIHVGVRYLPAGAAAYSLGGLNGFVLNRRWTFSHTGRIARSAVRYAAVTAIGVCLNLVLLRLAVAIGVPRAAGEVAAVAPVTLLTFALNRAWAFAASDVPSYPPAQLAGRARHWVRGRVRARPASGTAGAGDRG